MTDKYPKVTQEGLEAAVTILLGNMQEAKYLDGAPYSSLMIKKIDEVTTRFKNSLENGSLNTYTQNPSKAWSPEDDQIENEDIEKRFSNLNEDLENRSGSYRDDYGVIVRLEKIIRGMERMAHGGSSDSVKMSAMGKLMDFQQEQVKVLMSITNIEKAQKIEAITRRFFQEIRKNTDLGKVADRYLTMLNDLD